MLKYCVYYETIEKMFRVCYSDLTIETLARIPKQMSSFYISGKSYEANDEDLQRYCVDIKLASDELATSQSIKFNYIEPLEMKNGKTYFRTHQTNIETVFKMKSKGKYDNHEPIDMIEDAWFNRCNNGGLQFCEPGVYETCCGYDFSNYYASILGESDLQIPTKPGKQLHINELPAKLLPGFYHVKITSDDVRILKVFTFSSHNVYHYLSLKFALELKEKYSFDINFELQTDVKYNAYIYEFSDQVKTSTIFKNWYKHAILALKQEFPKNMLCKMLSSSLWGHMSRRNITCVDEERIDDYDVGLSPSCEYCIIDYVTKANNTSYYKLVKNAKPYNYNIRLKPFITAFGRNMTAKVALLDLDNVVRIHTDGICFKTSQAFSIKNLKPEDKTTGRVEFRNVNNYKKI